MPAICCPYYNKKLTAPDETLGKNGRCPNCRQVFPLRLASPSGVAKPSPDSATLTAGEPARVSSLPAVPAAGPYARTVVMLASIPFVIAALFACYWFGLRDFGERNHYPEYHAKVQGFLDVLVKLDTAMEIGVNFDEYQDHLKELNFNQKRVDVQLSVDEKRYPSWLAMNRAFALYLRAQTQWEQHRFETTRKVDSLDQAGQLRQLFFMLREPDMVEARMSWLFASGLVRTAQEIVNGQDELRKAPCPTCEHSGAGPCTLCEGSGKCLLEESCKGKGEETCYGCRGRGKCRMCGGKGSIRCEVCGGKGETGGDS